MARQAFTAIRAWSWNRLFFDMAPLIEFMITFMFLEMTSSSIEQMVGSNSCEISKNPSHYFFKPSSFSFWSWTKAFNELMKFSSKMRIDFCLLFFMDLTAMRKDGTLPRHWLISSARYAPELALFEPALRELMLDGFSGAPFAPLSTLSMSEFVIVFSILSEMIKLFVDTPKFLDNFKSSVDRQKRGCF